VGVLERLLELGRPQERLECPLEAGGLLDRRLELGHPLERLRHPLEAVSALDRLGEPHRRERLLLEPYRLPYVLRQRLPVALNLGLALGGALRGERALRGEHPREDRLVHVGRRLHGYTAVRVIFTLRGSLPSRRAASRGGSRTGSRSHLGRETG
jgi:hypothetical protein